jgi:hypothetical protein
MFKNVGISTIVGILLRVPQTEIIAVDRFQDRITTYGSAGRLVENKPPQ